MKVSTTTSRNRVRQLDINLINLMEVKIRWYLSETTTTLLPNVCYTRVLHICGCVVSTRHTSLIKFRSSYANRSCRQQTSNIHTCILLCI